MSEDKFAALSSGLLARKGSAKPAMRRQAFMNPQGEVSEDLGWNDMGLETPHPVDGSTEYHGEAPMPEVLRQQDQLAEGLQNGDAINGDAEANGGFVPEREPYKHDGHGGLTPMGAEDIEDEDEEEVVGEYPSDAEAETANGSSEDESADDSDGPDQGVRLYAGASTSDRPAEAPKKQQPLTISRGAEPIETPRITPSAKRAADKVPAREKVAFTLRLDKDRHLKLRLASAVTNQSAQRLVTEALDRFLEEHPEVQALSGQAGGKTH